MLARLDICIAGRISEEVFFGAENVTSGASSDIQQATKLARNMVTKYGLSDKVGPLYFDDKEKYSGVTQNEVDAEIKKLLSDSYDRAKNLILSNKRELELIAEGLIEHETLSGNDIIQLLQGNKLTHINKSQRPSREIAILPINKKPLAVNNNPHNNNESNSVVLQGQDSSNVVSKKGVLSNIINVFSSGVLASTNTPKTMPSETNTGISESGTSPTISTKVSTPTLTPPATPTSSSEESGSTQNQIQDVSTSPPVTEPTTKKRGPPTK